TVTQIRIASPSVLAPLGIKRRALRTFCAGSLGQVGRPFPERPCASPLQQWHRASFPSEIPVGFLKGISSVHHRFLETRKGVPTNWAGTPDTSLSRPSQAFCQVPFSE